MNLGNGMINAPHANEIKVDCFSLRLYNMISEEILHLFYIRLLLFSHPYGFHVNSTEQKP